MLAALVLLYVLVLLCVCVVTSDSRSRVDGALMAFTSMIIVLQLVVAMRSAPPSKTLTTNKREMYLDYSRVARADDYEDAKLSDMPSGMVLYVSGFLASSYPGSGKMIKNVAVTDAYPAPDAEKNMFFRVDPAFSRRDGASMSANTMTGPLSFKMDIKGDLAFTTVTVCQFTGVTNGPADVIMQRIYANTPDNNGFCVFMKNFKAMSGNMISLDMYVTFGSSPPYRCSQAIPPAPIILDTNKKYMVVASKGMGKLKLTLVDVGVHTTYDSQVLLDAKLDTKESVVFSNREMMINNNENWNANLMAFAVFDRMLTDTDVHNLYAHYTSVFRKMDPEYKAMLTSLKEATDAKACPFDEMTCTACASVSDFTDPKLIIASSDRCLASIDAFCTSNPSHPACWCWETKNPYYESRCRVYRSMFKGQQATDTVESPLAPGVAPGTDGMQQLAKFIASDQIVNAQGKTSVMNSLFSALHKPGVVNAVADAVSKVATAVDPAAGTQAPAQPVSKDAVQAMLTVLSDLKNTIPQSATQAAAAANVAQVLSGKGSSAQAGQLQQTKPSQPSPPTLQVSSDQPSQVQKPSTGGGWSLSKWFFGMNS